MPAKRFTTANMILPANFVAVPLCYWSFMRKQRVILTNFGRVINLQIVVFYLNIGNKNLKHLRSGDAGLTD